MMALPVRCKSCIHFCNDTGYKDYDACIYRLNVFRGRPCPVGPHCTVYERKTGRKRWNSTPRREIENYVFTWEESLCGSQSLDLTRQTRAAL